ncbi:MAG: penicillin-binding protein activator LpoB, partial [Desulfobulbaceae bacterium]|nr:penicillin-binding protein activator LpoB [Desulfobulbaceae bacterium]
RFGHKIVPEVQTEAIFTELPPRADETLRSAARRFGTETGASHVLTGTVWRYSERVGSAMAAEKPASVGFNVMLVRTKDGVILWNEEFDKTQNSLAENLLDAPMFVSKGMRWLSAEELASFGVEKTLRAFPDVTGP